MRVLVTGNMGYIGSTLTRMLAESGHEVTGFDTNYYRGCAFNRPHSVGKQINKDIRDVSAADLKGMEAVIHLAALSNDPLGELDPGLTNDINHVATVKLAEIAKGQGIGRFVFASSCSIYGIADEEVSEDSKLGPVTEYAITKLRAERALAGLADKDFSPVYMRPATAYGVSPFLRVDIVLNNLVGWAFTTGKIRMLSDGSPWRPAVHVEDFSRAFIAAMSAPVDIVHNQAFNVGRNEDNYRIIEMAEIVKETVPGCRIEYAKEHGPDSRTYKVSFDKITTQLKDYYKPKWNIRMGAKEMYEAFKEHGLTEKEFTSSMYIRINQLKDLIGRGKLDSRLFWKKK